MTTTEIFIELFIVGLQASIWVIFFLLSILGYDWIDFTKIQANDLFVIFILTLPIAYPLGIMLDNLTDRLLIPLEKKITEGIRDTEQHSIMRLLIQSKNAELLDYFEYVRRRIRICRSSLINFPLIAISIAVFAVSNSTKLNIPASKILYVCIIVGILVTGLAIYNWINLTTKFSNQINKAYKIIEGDSSSTTR